MYICVCVYKYFIHIPTKHFIPRHRAGTLEAPDDYIRDYGARYMYHMTALYWQSVFYHSLNTESMAYDIFKKLYNATFRILKCEQSGHHFADFSNYFLTWISLRFDLSFTEMHSGVHLAITNRCFRVRFATTNKTFLFRWFYLLVLCTSHCLILVRIFICMNLYEPLNIFIYKPGQHNLSQPGWSLEGCIAIVATAI